MLITSNITDVHIDESGDPGFKFVHPKCHSSSEWFIYSAVLSRKEDTPKIIQVIDEIEHVGWGECGATAPNLHWYKFKHSHKLMIAGKLASLPITVITVGVWKTKLTKPIFTVGTTVFTYAAKLLLERVSWYVSEQNSTANVIFANRNKSYDSAMTTYISNLIARPRDSIRPVFNSKMLKFAPANSLKMLLIADMYAGIHRDALEPDQFGFVEPRYLQLVAHQMYESVYGKQLGYGLKLFPDDFKQELGGRYRFLVDCGLIEVGTYSTALKLLPHG